MLWCLIWGYRKLRYGFNKKKRKKSLIEDKRKYKVQRVQHPNRGEFVVVTKNGGHALYACDCGQ